MDDLQRTETANQVSTPVDPLSENGLIAKTIIALRRKPGRHKKDKPRIEKVSCRLTEQERNKAREYCKAHGITEAKLLRASYLAATTQAPDERVDKMLDILMPLDDSNLSFMQKAAVRLRAKDMLRNSAMLLLLILLGCTVIPRIIRYYSGVASTKSPLIINGNESCIFYGNGKPGCVIIERDKSPSQWPQDSVLKWSK